ncbi:MAG: TetR/AcrR family transcriptional regulator [Burkholderiaceae bacterium]|nr:TetR/AcrR family transcriptional regulator [Burkholderiaceae bacterium]
MDATAEPDAMSRTQARALSQRNRILEAARLCFIEHGFHAASMANIAEAAGMSAGLIYRYFDSKNAIILAIIERQLQDSREGIAALQAGTVMAELFGEVFARWTGGDETLINPALLLEMSALATRDAQIAEALAESDRVTRAEFGEWLKGSAGARGRPPLGDDEARRRAFLVQCIFEGLAVRAAREPALDPGFVAESLRPLADRL